MNLCAPIHSASLALPGKSIACAVLARGAAIVPFGDIAAHRKVPGPLGRRTLAPSLLKHADHQTVVAIVAVLRAVHDAGWAERSFAEWGVIAAPRFLGRVPGAAAMQKFKAQGVPSMSPLIIPTLSLHSTAASVSLALKTQGFSYGVGGGHGHLAEALLCALAAAEDNGVPGVWVVVTQFSPEPIPDAAGNSRNPCVAYAAALAISAWGADQSRFQLRLDGAACSAAGAGDERVVAGDEPPSGLVALAEFLTAPVAVLRPRRWSCPLPSSGALEIEDDPARALHGAAWVPPPDALAG